MKTDFCPVCGEQYPYHHSGVKHDFESPLMKAYHAREDLPEDDPHVIEMRASDVARDNANALLIASEDLKYLKNMEWSMGNGQCPVCCGLQPGFHSFGGILRNGEWIDWYEEFPDARDAEKHADGCALAAKIKELENGQ